MPSFLRVCLLFFFTNVGIQVSVIPAYLLRRENVRESNNTKRLWKNIDSHPASCEQNDPECISSDTLYILSSVLLKISSRFSECQ